MRLHQALSPPIDMKCGVHYQPLFDLIGTRCLRAILFSPMHASLRIPHFRTYVDKAVVGAFGSSKNSLFKPSSSQVTRSYPFMNRNHSLLYVRTDRTCPFLYQLSGHVDPRFVLSSVFIHIKHIIESHVRFRARFRARFSGCTV